VDPDLFVPGYAKLKYAELYLSRVYLSNKKESSCPRLPQPNKNFFLMKYSFSRTYAVLGNWRGGVGWRDVSYIM
jgi:hypothetical protein